CILLDVNFTGYDLGKENISELGLDKMFTEFDGKEDDAEEITKPIVIVSATSGRTTSQDLEKHGLFATVVLEALQGKADTSGSEADGIVTARELEDYVSHEIPMRSKGPNLSCQSFSAATCRTPCQSIPRLLPWLRSVWPSSRKSLRAARRRMKSRRKDASS